MNPIIEKAIELWNKLIDKLNELMDAINWILGKIPWGLGWVGDKIREGWNWLMEKWGELVAWCDEHLNNPGSPSALSQAAQNWNSQVGGPVSSQAGVIDAGQLTADDTWTGTAADAYKQAIAPQKTAMDKIKTGLIEGMQQTLDKMQTGIIVFWTAFGAGVAACIAGFITALASTATVLGAPAGPVIAAGAVIILIAALGGGALKLKGDINSSKTILTGKLNDLSAFPNGSWPKATLAS